MDSGVLTYIIAVSLILGVITGFVMHRADLCFACAFRNLFIFRETFMLRILALLVVVSMALFEAARLTGLLKLYPFPGLGPPSLTNLLGGMLFGFGMVLAGGCVVGTLYRMGAGNFLSALAFLGLLMGSIFFAEIYPWWMRLAEATSFAGGKVTLPQMLGVSPSLLVWPLLLAAGVPLYHGFRDGRFQRRSYAEGYLQPWKAALILAGVGVSSAILIGMPLGITTAYSKLGSALERMVFPAHVAQASYYAQKSLDYLLPFGYERLTGGPGPFFDAFSAIQFPLVGGIICGGTLSALLLKEFRVYWRVPLGHCLSAFIGGALMGLASRMAPACNVWHLCGGLPILAGQSLLFLIGLFPGVWLGSQVLVKAVIRP